MGSGGFPTPTQGACGIRGHSGRQAWFFPREAQNSNSKESHCNLTHRLCIQLNRGKVRKQKKGKPTWRLPAFHGHPRPHASAGEGAWNRRCESAFSSWSEALSPQRSCSPSHPAPVSLLKLHLFCRAWPLKANQHLICRLIKEGNPFQSWRKTWLCWSL